MCDVVDTLEKSECRRPRALESAMLARATLARSDDIFSALARFTLFRSLIPPAALISACENAAKAMRRTSKIARLQVLVEPMLHT